MAAVVERTAGASPALAAAAAAAVPPPLPFRLLPTAPTTWDPAAANVTLNVRLDGCIVPSEKQGGRIAYSHAGGLGRPLGGTAPLFACVTAGACSGSSLSYCALECSSLPSVL